MNSNVSESPALESVVTGSASRKCVRLDLHVHSDRSDGKYPPEEVLRRAAAAGIDVLALSDHDLDPVLRHGNHEVEGRHIRVVASAEVSGHHAGKEFHLLWYFQGATPPEASVFLRKRAQSRAHRYDAAMAKLGVADRADAEAHAGSRALTRYHLADALVRCGRVKNPHDAWHLLGSDTVPLIDLSFVDAIKAARGFGALTSWAHPSTADANKYIAEFVAAGLQGVEAARPSLDKSTRKGLRALAKKHGLFITGGSDWHGWWQGDLGDFRFEDEHASAFVVRLDQPAVPVDQPGAG